MAVSFRRGVSSALGHRPAGSDSFTLRRWASFPVNDTDPEQPLKVGKLIKGQLNSVCVCTPAAGRKMQSSTFVLVSYGQGAKPPPAHCAYSLPRFCSVTCQEARWATEPTNRPGCGCIEREILGLAEQGCIYFRMFAFLQKCLSAQNRLSLINLMPSSFIIKLCC